MDIKPNQPETAASMPATCPIRVIEATTPSRRYSTIMYTTIRSSVIRPAITIAFSAPSPMVGEMVLKLVVSRENGSAPELILSASSLALS